MPPQSPPYDFSKTRRILLFIDLYPLVTSPNPTHYISTLTAAATRLLRFPPLSGTLFSFKFFNSTTGLVHPFDLPLVTLDSFSTALKSISLDAGLVQSSIFPDAARFVQSLAHLADDYSWEETETPGKDELIGDCYGKKVPSNLVMLFSPAICFIDYCTVTDFDGVLSAVREAFVKKGIHLCWIDVKSDGEPKLCGVAILKGGIEKMGWGFCSSDLIVLGSTILPLGLIYPKIGIPSYLGDFEDSDKRKCHGALSLKILDVKGMPLECKCCDLEFVRPRCIGSNDSEVGNAGSKEYGQDRMFSHFGSGSIKLHVTEIHPYERLVKTQGASEIVLVRERLHGSGEGKTGGDFFADRVLGMLCEEMGGVANGSQLPIWQMFLDFLYVKGCWASVSISSSIGAASMGTLKPLSTHLAVLSIFRADHTSVNAESNLELPKIDSLSNGTCTEDMRNLNICHGSQTETSTSRNCPQNGDGKKKKSQRYMYQDMTWSSFCRAAFGGSDLDLIEVYSSRKFEKSKKLKFFKCWIKQIVRIDTCELMKLHGSKSLQESSTCKGLSPEPSPGEADAIPFSNAETAEVFFDNITKTIQHGLESGMDLQSLAERIVKSSFQWLHQKSAIGNSLEGQQTIGNSNDSCSGPVGTLTKHLLRNCKEMKKIHQNDASGVSTSDHCSSPENLVREYEIEVFLRMEILVSEFSVMIEESRKQKLVKQICSLLEIMQFIIAGGLHGHLSLYDYVEQTIKARYSDRLEDVVKQIYSELELDLLLYGEEDETPSLLLNSEDSNQSWRDNRLEKSKIAEANNFNRSLSFDNDSSQPPANSAESPHGEDHFDILRAKEKREKNRRFVSFTRQAPDLQRVWAPKQPKTTKYKFDSLPKKSRKKDKRGLTYSVVCETPLTGNKRTHSGDRGDRGHQDIGKSSHSVSKALFQDL